MSLAVWEAGRWFATGEVPQRLGSAHQSQAPYQAVRTADGWATLGAITTKTWAGMCRAPGLPDLLDDGRFATSSARHALREEVVGRVEGATSQLPTAEVVRRLESEGVPCALILNFGQVFTDETDVRPGESKDDQNPWQPSTTMLTYRLASTTEESGVEPERTVSVLAERIPDQSQTHNAAPPPPSRTTASPNGLNC